MLKRFMIALFLLPGLVHAGGVRDNEWFRQIVLLNDVFVKGQVLSINRTYWVEGKEVSHAQIKKTVKEYYDKKLSELDNKLVLDEDSLPTKAPNWRVKTQLDIKVLHIFEMKDGRKAKLKNFKYTVDDLFSSMCPYPETNLKEGEEAIFYYYKEGKKWRGESEKISKSFMNFLSFLEVYEANWRD